MDSKTAAVKDALEPVVAETWAAKPYNGGSMISYPYERLICWVKGFDDTTADGDESAKGSLGPNYKTVINEIVAALPSLTMRTVIICRFGLTDGYLMKRKEVGDVIGKSPARVYQIEKEAISRMRLMAYKWTLKERGRQ